LSNPHLWPILACAAAGLVIVAGVWFLLLRNWARTNLRWLCGALAVVLTGGLPRQSGCLADRAGIPGDAAGRCGEPSLAWRAADDRRHR